MRKKGIEIQFNWLFVLVAGAAILIFFSMIIVKQKNVSDASTQASILKSMDAIISGAGATPDTINTIKLPESIIETECNRISVGGMSKQYLSLILFAPDTLKGNSLITHTQGLNVPFRAANLLHLADLSTKYIIITNTPPTLAVNASLPRELKKETLNIFTPDTLRPNSKTRIIISGTESSFSLVMPANMQRLPDSDLSALRIDGTLDFGEIEFYKKRGANWISDGKSSYIGKQSLMGAVYSDSREHYECSMRNSLLRVNSVARVYHEKTERLSAAGGECASIYSSALPDINSIITASGALNSANVALISSSSVSLQSKNEQLRRMSCPMIY